MAATQPWFKGFMMKQNVNNDPDKVPGLMSGALVSSSDRPSSLSNEDTGSTTHAVIAGYCARGAVQRCREDVYGIAGTSEIVLNGADVSVGIFRNGGVQNTKGFFSRRVRDNFVGREAENKEGRRPV